MHRQPQCHWMPAKRLLALAVLATCSWGTQALTLGRFQVLSGTGEPLRAEVEITDFTPQQLQGLSARIAPLASFQAAGMEYNPGLEGVSARIQQRSNGRPYIVLTGNTPLRDHFIDVILETQWSTGRLVKNYALLLNPGNNAPVGAPSGLPAPSVAQLSRENTAPVAIATPVQTPQARTDESLNARVETNARQVPVYRFDAPAVSATPAQPNRTVAAERSNTTQPRPLQSEKRPPPNTDGRIEVQTGDTLSQIALNHLPANISLDQMMVALLKANPDAFIEDNVNLVKAGVVLQIPDAQQAALVSRQEARRMVSEQTRAFMDYSRQLAQSPLRLRRKGSAQEVTGQVETPPATEPASPAARDTLKLSQGTVATANEAARVATQQELKDTDAQVAQVTRNLQDLQTLAKGQAPADAGTVPGLPALPKADDVKPAPADQPGITAPAPETPASAPVSGFMHLLANDRNTQIWAGALVLALGLFAYWIARRRRQDEEDDFAPEYGDSSLGQGFGIPVAGNTGAMPGQMPNLDLNLDPASSATPAGGSNFGTPVQSFGDMAPAPATASHDTDLSKLNLAAQLVSKGEHDLARALLASVLNAASPELRSKAQDMLSRLP